MSIASVWYIIFQSHVGMNCLEMLILTDTCSSTQNNYIWFFFNLHFDGGTFLWKDSWYYSFRLPWLFITWSSSNVEMKTLWLIIVHVRTTWEWFLEFNIIMIYVVKQPHCDSVARAVAGWIRSQRYKLPTHPLVYMWCNLAPLSTAHCSLPHISHLTV